MALGPGHLSREQMEAVIDAGGSVAYQGRIINNKAFLPTEIELARGDEGQEKAAAAKMEARVAELQQQIDAARGNADPATLPVDPGAPPEPEAPVEPNDPKKSRK